MPTLPKTIATVACASLLAACPALAGTAAAHPAGHRHATHRHVHTHTNTHRHGQSTHGKAHEHGKPADHLAGLRRGAGHAISAQLKVLRQLRTFADSLDLTDEGALLAALDADIDAVQADLDAVADAGSRADLHALMTAAITGHRLGGLQVEVVAEADAVGAEAASLTPTVEALVGQLSEQPGNAAAQAALEEAMSLLGTVTAQVGNGDLGVIGFVLHISPTVGRAELHSDAVNVHVALESISDMLAQAEADIATAQAQV
jgi:hypothetical protein